MARQSGEGEDIADGGLLGALHDELLTADGGGKVEPVFSVDVTDELGQVVAQVEKLLYVRRKLPQ